MVADGLESAADVFASGFVLFGLTLAAKPADENHPYGHGRVETLTGLLIGLVLTVGGALISWSSSASVGQPHEALQAFVIWPLVLSLAAKTGLAALQVPLRQEAAERRADGRRVERRDGYDLRHRGAGRRGADAVRPRALRATPTATAGSWWG